jgi:hypothetical protein
MGSLLGDFFTFRPGVSDPEETMDVPADHKDNAGAGSTDYLKRKKPGTGVNICVCGLGKSTKYSQYLNDS